MRAGTSGFVDYALLFVLALIFGASFMFTSVAVESVAPLTVAASRLVLGALLVFPIMLLRGQNLPITGRVWIFIVASAFFGNALPFALITWGQVKVDAGLTAIFMAVMPLMTVLLAHIFTADEKMNRYKIIGMLFGLAGVIVLIGWNQLGGLGDDMLRQYAIAFAAMCYGINAIVTKHLTRIPRLSMIFALLLCASLMLLPFALAMEQPWQNIPDKTGLIAIMFLAVGPTLLATFMILVIIDRRGASFLSQINFLVPLCGILLAYIFLDESLPAKAWLALCIILTGIALSRLGNRVAQ